MKIRFKVESKTPSFHHVHGARGAAAVSLVSVMLVPTPPEEAGGKHPNPELWAGAPMGSLHLDRVSPDAVKDLEVGKEYEIELTPAESDATKSG